MDILIVTDHEHGSQSGLRPWGIHAHAPRGVLPQDHEAVHDAPSRGMVRGRSRLKGVRFAAPRGFVH